MFPSICQGGSHGRPPAGEAFPQRPQPGGPHSEREFELPGDEAIMHREGYRLVIEPARKRGLVALLKSMKPLDEAFPAIDDPVPGL